MDYQFSGWFIIVGDSLFNLEWNGCVGEICTIRILFSGDEVGWFYQFKENNVAEIIGH